ncbi:MAG: hypothetical protein LBE76_01005 [Nitrososphaerota archaeon]|jgi:type I restriction enzyme S subunit|nr:hypothetical protein [Nitrososphaerota archaeon]
MNVILSIKPKYCQKISEGVKKYEFRKKIFKANTDWIYMYSSSPVKKIVGKFTVGNIIEDNPEFLWKNCKEHSGITEMEFFEYFNGVKNGFAIKIENVKMFNPINPEKIIPNFKAPQSYCYIKE